MLNNKPLVQHAVVVIKGGGLGIYQGSSNQHDTDGVLFNVGSTKHWIPVQDIHRRLRWPATIKEISDGLAVIKKDPCRIKNTQEMQRHLEGRWQGGTFISVSEAVRDSYHLPPGTMHDIRGKALKLFCEEVVLQFPGVREEQVLHLIDGLCTRKITSLEGWVKTLMNQPITPLPPRNHRIEGSPPPARVKPRAPTTPPPFKPSGAVTGVQIIDGGTTPAVPSNPAPQTPAEQRAPIADVSITSEVVGEIEELRRDLSPAEAAIAALTAECDGLAAKLKSVEEENCHLRHELNTAIQNAAEAAALADEQIRSLTRQLETASALEQAKPVPEEKKDPRYVKGSWNP
jgi:hypothetical protein